MAYVIYIKGRNPAWKPQFDKHKYLYSKKIEMKYWWRDGRQIPHYMPSVVRTKDYALTFETRKEAEDCVAELEKDINKWINHHKGAKLYGYKCVIEEK